MNTDNFEHYGDIRMENDDNYWHGYGLEPVPMYSSFFFVLDRGALSLYDKDLLVTDTIDLSLGNLGRSTEKVLFSPSSNRALSRTYTNSGSGVIDVIDVKNATIISTIASVPRDSDIELLKDGSFLIMYPQSREIDYYDKDGLLINSFANPLFINSRSIPIVVFNERKKVVAILGGGGSNSGFYDASFSNALFEGTRAATSRSVNGATYTSRDGYWYQDSESTATFYELDYANEQVVSTTRIDSKHILREVNGKIYYAVADNDIYLFDIKQKTTEKVATVSTQFNCVDVDNRSYYIASNYNTIRVHDIETHELIAETSSTTDKNDRNDSGRTNGIGINFLDYK